MFTPKSTTKTKKRISALEETTIDLGEGREISVIRKQENDKETFCLMTKFPNESGRVGEFLLTREQIKELHDALKPYLPPAVRGRDE